MNERKNAAFAEPVGLTKAEARRLLNRDGGNVLEERKKRRAAAVFAGQFKDVMSLILMVAAAVSALLGQAGDALPILAILVMNAVLGFVQEYRCEKTLERLSELTAPTARAYRDGELMRLPAAELVAGDVVEISAGDRVPADCAVLSCSALLCDESMLTGESAGVEKRPRNSETDTEAPSLPYMVYMGTVCTRGSARAIVTATGRRTQMGKVSGLIADAGGDLTPLQKKLGELGRVLALICLGVCGLVFAAGVLRGEPVFNMLMTAISIAVAAIPEGLPAAVTIALALAVRRMLRRNALINKLHSVETLGCAGVICTDKTGTLTMNSMTARKAVTCGESLTEYTLSEKGAETPEGAAVVWESRALSELMLCAAVCNNAAVTREAPKNARDRGGRGAAHIEGDPTEAAVLAAALNCGVEGAALRAQRVSEEPFDSRTRRMSVTVESESGPVTYRKGAPDVILPMCSYVWQGEQQAPLRPQLVSALSRRAEELASEGMRLLAFSQTVEGREVLLGLMALNDPPRPEAEASVRECARAGIRTVMITGDHKQTACAVARQTGILREGGTVLTGAELDRMSDEQLAEAADTASVFARVTPEHKLRIVRAFKARGQVCAMTGDGVNDAPALKEASIGVAMGKSGTDVARQAADCILLDDDFSTLVSAVREGRTIYRNIRKFVRYLISCNIGEVLTMLGGIIMGLPMVLVPSQLLLINLVTDGLPAAALGCEPAEDSVMSEPPRREQDSFFSGGLLYRMTLRGVLIGIMTLAAFTLLLPSCGLAAARTGATVTLVLSQLIHVFECKSETRPIYKLRLTDNPLLIGAVLLSLAVLVGCMLVPALGAAFALTHLSLKAWLICIALSAAVPAAALFIRC